MNDQLKLFLDLDLPRKQLLWSTEIPSKGPAESKQHQTDGIVFKCIPYLTTLIA